MSTSQEWLIWKQDRNIWGMVEQMIDVLTWILQNIKDSCQDLAKKWHPKIPETQLSDFVIWLFCKSRSALYSLWHDTFFPQNVEQVSISYKSHLKPILANQAKYWISCLFGLNHPQRNAPQNLLQEVTLKAPHSPHPRDSRKFAANFSLTRKTLREGKNHPISEKQWSFVRLKRKTTVFPNSSFCGWQN